MVECRAFDWFSPPPSEKEASIGSLSSEKKASIGSLPSEKKARWETMTRVAVDGH